MKKLLEGIDLFSYTINFNYQQKNAFHSFYGISLSVIVYSTMIFFSYYFSQDLIYMINPKVFYKEIEFLDFKNLNVSNFMGSFDFSFLIYVEEAKNEKFKNNLGKPITDLSILETKINMNTTGIINNKSKFYDNPFFDLYVSVLNNGIVDEMHSIKNHIVKITENNFTSQCFFDSNKTCHVYSVDSLMIKEKMTKEKFTNYWKNFSDLLVEFNRNSSLKFELHTNLGNWYGLNYFGFVYIINFVDNIINVNNHDFFRQVSLDFSEITTQINNEYYINGYNIDHGIIEVEDNKGFILSQKNSNHKLLLKKLFYQARKNDEDV